MAYKKKSVEFDTLPESVRECLDAFENAFGSNNYTVSYLRQDAVFVQCQGICNLYLVARLIKHNPQIYVELESDAPNTWSLRMFNSDWQREHSLPRYHRLIDSPPIGRLETDYIRHVWVRASEI